jgi:hypothetical protein
MKLLFIILSVIFLLFIGSQLLFFKSSHNIEEYKYVVIKEYPGFEIRKYEASLFTSVELDTDDYKQASSKGFLILGGYIFGKNESKEQISMTSPVAMILEADETTMMFLVPKKKSKEGMPKPVNSNIKFIEIPEKQMAAITFRGWASNQKIEKYKLELVRLLDQKGIQHMNKFLVMGYNPPYEVLFRKNEIVVELE